MRVHLNFVVATICCAVIYIGNALPASAQCVGLQLPPIVRADPAAGDHFGQSVGMDAGRAVVGAPGDDDLGDASGSVYLFDWHAPSWSQVGKLTASGGVSGDQFGYAATIQINTIAVGSPGRAISGTQSGAVELFDYTVGSGWLQTQELSPASGSSGQQFGFSIDLDMDTLVVGSPAYSFDSGAAYVFRRTAGVWAPDGMLIASDSAWGNRFGYDVAVSGDRILVGAPYQDPGGYWNRGVVYVFERSAGVWHETAKLGDMIASAGGHMGTCVDIDGDTAFAGAANGDSQIYSKASGAWVQQATLHGYCDASLQGSTLIGLMYDWNGYIHVFTCVKSTQGWSEFALYDVPGDSTILPRVVFDGDKYIVGVPSDGPFGVESGAGKPFWFTNSLTYCTPKATSIPGCLATLSATGAPTMSNPASYVIHAGSAPGGRLGLFFWGWHGPDIKPFQGGFLCVQTPSKRSKVILSGGTLGACDGSYSISAADIALTDPHYAVGTQFNIQLWFRDVGAIGDTSLSDALAFVVCP